MLFLLNFVISSGVHLSTKMAPPNVPASLKSIQPYITKAEEMKTADPVVSYYCISTHSVPS